MKMVKSLLLGSAAGLVAVTAGQAADLPVKAQPVQYVKVCSLYGAGFYYMPGTDTCIKIGGWTRAELVEGGNGSVTWGPFNANANTRATSNVIMRARGYITADAREQTGYGVARGYIAVGLATNDIGLQVAQLVDSVNRAYVQFAGFTAGLAQSFYDFYSVPAATYRGGYFPASDTGDGGWWVWGYTANFGGGLSATLSAEARRTTQICDLNAATASTTTNCTLAPGSYGSAVAGAASLLPGVGAYGGQQVPDIVANLRIDQAWGSAQVMGAYHDVNATYNSPTTGAAPAGSAGHPSDVAGWAVGAGLKVNFPSFAPGDYFQSQVNYTQGAVRYLFNTPNTNWGATNGANETYSILSDCVYDVGVGGINPTGCQLTTAWGFNASYEHYWTPNFHESLFGNYYQVSYNSIANANLCSALGFGAGSGTTATATPGCSENWSTWGAGTRLQYDVTKSMYIGVEAMYETMTGASQPAGTALPTAAIGTIGSATGFQSSTSAWNFTLRMHKDFLP
jgi:Porin subfamily